MKYFWVTVICCIAMISCKDHSSKNPDAIVKDSTYTIIGKIQGVDSGWVYLMHDQSDAHVPDSAKIDSGFFTFTGKADAPEYCLLGIPNNGSREYRLGFFVENGKINLSGKKDSVADATITGSVAQDEYKNYIASRKSLDEEEAKLRDLYDIVEAKKDPRLTDSLKKIFELYEKKQKDFIKEYIKNHPASYVGALQVYQNFSYNPDASELETMYNSFAANIQSSSIGKKIKATLEAAQKTAIGNTAPEFSQNDANGKAISLSSFKGKYVLVDFWASWCGPCRVENPNVVKAFQKFHSKGFDILGVSVDEKKDKWMDAIKKDNLNWHQVSDLQGWKNSVAQLYGVEGIPMNFLIDKEGKIIGKGLRGEDLEKKLAEVLK